MTTDKDKNAVPERAINVILRMDDWREYITPVNFREYMLDSEIELTLKRARFIASHESERVKELEEGLVDCPACEGLGFREDDKLCLCCCENSQGWSPGKLPYSRAAKYIRDRTARFDGELAPLHEELETLKNAVKHNNLYNKEYQQHLKDTNVKLREELEAAKNFKDLTEKLKKQLIADGIIEDDQIIPQPKPPSEGVDETNIAPNATLDVCLDCGWYGPTTKTGLSYDMDGEGGMTGYEHLCPECHEPTEDTDSWPPKQPHWKRIIAMGRSTPTLNVEKVAKALVEDAHVAGHWREMNKHRIIASMDLDNNVAHPGTSFGVTSSGERKSQLKSSRELLIYAVAKALTASIAEQGKK